MEERNDEQRIEPEFSNTEKYLSTDGLQEYERSVSIISHRTVSALQENGVDIHIDPCTNIYDAIGELTNSLSALERQKRTAIIFSELNVHNATSQNWRTVGNINQQKSSIEYKKQLLSIVLKLSEASFTNDGKMITRAFAGIVVNRDLRQDDRLEFLRVAHQLISEYKVDLSMIDVLHTLQDSIGIEEEVYSEHYFDRSGWYVLNKIAVMADQNGGNVMEHEAWDLFVEKIIERGIYRFIESDYVNDIDETIYELAVDIGIDSKLVHQLIQEVGQ